MFGTLSGKNVIEFSNGFIHGYSRAIRDVNTEIKARFQLNKHSDIVVCLIVYVKDCFHLPMANLSDLFWTI